MKTIVLKPSSHPEAVIRPEQSNCRGCSSFYSLPQYDNGEMCCYNGVHWTPDVPIAPPCFDYDQIFLAAKANMASSIELHGSTEHPDTKNAIKRAASLAPPPLKENPVELAYFLGLDSEKGLA